MSTARRWTSARIHVDAFARSGTKRGALRHTARKPSCTASSASDAVAEHAHAEAVRDAAVAVVELAERGLVRARDERDDGLVGKVREVPCHRGRAYNGVRCRI